MFLYIQNRPPSYSELNEDSRKSLYFFGLVPVKSRLDNAAAKLVFPLAASVPPRIPLVDRRA
jgi:hypothetical protein